MYRSTKDIAATVRATLKEKLPEYKFSVTTEHYTQISVSLMAGPVPVLKHSSNGGYVQLNPWYLNNDDRLTKDGLRVMTIALAALNAEWWDKSEPQTDYFCCAFYRSLNIGRWDRPYVIR